MLKVEESMEKVMRLSLRDGNNLMDSFTILEEFCSLLF